MTTKSRQSRLGNVWPFGIGALLWNAFAWAAVAPDESLALQGCKGVAVHRQIHGSNRVRDEPDTNKPDGLPVSAPAFPLQLEMRVPFEPTAFPSAGHVYLMYELHLTNFEMNPVSLRRIEVLDADSKAARPIATLEASELDALLQIVGSWPSGGNPDSAELRSGQSAILFLCIAFDRAAHVPNELIHRVVTADSASKGVAIGTHHTELRVLAPPVKGTDWLASDGPSNDEGNHHRRGIPVFDGRTFSSRRYAIDWQQSEDGSTFSGDALDKHSYHAYGKPVLAVADGRVVIVRDGFPENVPGHDEGFHPAVPITMKTVAGNVITLDLGGGQFAHYLHLQPGTLRVKAGDRVKRGQILAKIGSSGDSREPHLHFEVTDSPILMASEGVPYLIDHYRAKSAEDSWETRTQELPMKDMLIDFEADRNVHEVVLKLPQRHPKSKVGDSRPPPR
jgi:murein DD-endopeptidase MepM/ murein hydrolase activator NlpD